MTADRIETKVSALEFVRGHGVVLESARGGPPSLAAAIAGEPIRGGWWSHPRGKLIFALTRAIRDSPEVLTCRLIDGRITYVDRRLWPALVCLADRFPGASLAAIREVHGADGRHRVEQTPFAAWVPEDILKAAKKLTDDEALAPLAAGVSRSA